MGGVNGRGDRHGADPSTEREGERRDNRNREGDSRRVGTLHGVQREAEPAGMVMVRVRKLGRVRRSGLGPAIVVVVVMMMVRAVGVVVRVPVSVGMPMGVVMLKMTVRVGMRVGMRVEMPAVSVGSVPRMSVPRMMVPGADGDRQYECEERDPGHEIRRNLASVRRMACRGMRSGEGRAPLAQRTS